MHERAGPVVAAFLLICGSCARVPDFYSPPPQYPGARRYEPPLLLPGRLHQTTGILQDVVDDSEATGKSWTNQHPTFSFLLRRTEDLDFYMRFIVHDDTFRDTGPVTLTVNVNGETIDRPRFDTPGEREYSHPVPPRLLQKRNPVIVRIDVDPVWIAPGDKTKLGILLMAIGFGERDR